jgi:Uma2 family endonuclease
MSQGSRTVIACAFHRIEDAPWSGRGTSGLTADEFIAWALEQPTGRFELRSGIVVALAPERASDNQAKLNAVIALRAAIAATSLPCRAMTDGMTVRIDERTVYEPDALVRCGPPLSGDAVEVADPVIVVEVVSPSSRGIDRGVKLAGYLALPSVTHYVIVDTDGSVVIHHRRDDDGRIGVRVCGDGSLTLGPPGLTIRVDDSFEGV